MGRAARATGHLPPARLLGGAVGGEPVSGRGARAGGGVPVAPGGAPLRVCARAAPRVPRSGARAELARNRRFGGGVVGGRGAVLPRRAPAGGGPPAVERGVRGAARSAAAALFALDGD